MLRALRGATASAIATALLATSSPAQTGPFRPPAPISIDATAEHPVFGGTVGSTATRAAERVELLAGVHAQNDPAANAAATERLRRLVIGAIPGARITAASTAEIGAQMFRTGGGPYAGFVRVDEPRALGDVALRDLIARVLDAARRLSGSDTAAGASIVSVRLGYGSCAPFAHALRVRAAAQIAELAAALGPVPASRALVLHDQTFSGRPIDGPSIDTPLCGPAEHAERPTSIARPTTSSFEERATFGFAQPMTFVLDPRTAAPHVPDLFADSEHEFALHVRARGPVMTLEGHAYYRPRRIGTVYQYSGPNGVYRRSVLDEDALGTIRRRLLAAGVAGDAIVTQRDPSSGSWYVVARTRESAPSEKTVAAIGGDNPIERHAVHAVAELDDCRADTTAVQRAGSDAAARAARLTRALGGTADIAHPLAVVIEHGAALNACSGRNAPVSAFASPIERHLSGRLPESSADRPELRDVFVLATFPVALGSLGGPVRAPNASDPGDSMAARFGYVALPVDYPQALLAGDTRLERRLPPQRVRISLQLAPDNANAFRPIDPRFAGSLAAMLGARERDFSAAWVPSQGNLQNGEPEPDGIDFLAVLPYRGESTVRAANAALQSIFAVGYGGFNVVPQRDDCTAAADALAVDAIRAAARAAHPVAGARLVAIDLHGPFAVDGTCHAGPGGAENWSVRSVTIPDVRIGAAARVSYAAPVAPPAHRER